MQGLSAPSLDPCTWRVNPDHRGKPHCHCCFVCIGLFIKSNTWFPVRRHIPSQLTEYRWGLSPASTYRQTRSCDPGSSEGFTVTVKGTWVHLHLVISPLATSRRRNPGTSQGFGEEVLFPLGLAAVKIAQPRGCPQLPLEKDPPKAEANSEGNKAQKLRNRSTESQ